MSSCDKLPEVPYGIARNQKWSTEALLGLLLDEFSTATDKMRIERSFRDAQMRENGIEEDRVPHEHDPRHCPRCQSRSVILQETYGSALVCCPQEGCEQEPWTAVRLPKPATEGANAGIMCPRCGATEPFQAALLTVATVVVRSRGLGLEDVGPSEGAKLDDSQNCLCLECQHRAPLHVFRHSHLRRPGYPIQLPAVWVDLLGSMATPKTPVVPKGMHVHVADARNFRNDSRQVRVHINDKTELVMTLMSSRRAVYRLSVALIEEHINVVAERNDDALEAGFGRIGDISYYVTLEG